MRGSVLGYV